MNKLVVIRGVPGSGKSTYAKQHYSCLILEQDMFHMHCGKYEWDAKHMKDAVRWCSEAARHALKLGMDVVVCNTFVKRQHVDVYKRIAEDAGAELEVIHVIGDPSWVNTHNVPQHVLDAMRNGFEAYEGEREAVLKAEMR